MLQVPIFIYSVNSHIIHSLFHSIFFDENYSLFPYFGQNFTYIPVFVKISNGFEYFIRFEMITFVLKVTELGNKKEIEFLSY